jgi:hypothetical protein
MSLGPVGSPFPATPVAIVMAAFCSFMLGKFLLSAFRRRRDSTGSQGYVAGVIVAAYLLIMLLWGIWVHLGAVAVNR